MLKIRMVESVFKQLDYFAKKISAKEFRDYMAGETFSEDEITSHDVLSNEFLMVHELVEISELKKKGRTINQQTIMKPPKDMVYEAHFNAMKYELSYALLKENYPWIEKRLKDLLPCFDR